MRTITLIIVHCSANRAGSALRMADIDSYHRSLGWIGCGYHYVIPTDGTIEPGRPEEMVGAHCKNHNRHSIGVCYIGGLSKDGKPADTRTDAQRIALRNLLEQLHRRYPDALIVGHRDLDPQKECPCFDVANEYHDLQPR
ncbi:N-acetylmuramoyl-L-alanine amidase family 2 [Phocaeicola salanitronis DSM 18170]|uniref:N-acetylmuramoyl-L-alanine amidase family 2 n=1 Tax=Phocaeicola salanitronis (strain DSM 18170 / JCM 13657 / CCUG 60908 / BL78) TaxID=667015 RepID=F0R4K7_PHOSB|nr:N-acetylmuramoyl-L-alanine amidase [Phocaeicola salanitronis]ADY34697.1 N-acetylmuramoyl-L-alanine amidase family 2 [Phocaeicola salanitronis DSM 18170]